RCPSEGDLRTGRHPRRPQAGADVADLELPGRNLGCARRGQLRRQEPEAVRAHAAGRGRGPGQGLGVHDPYTASQNLRTSGNVGQSSSHLWRTEIPSDLGLGTHTAEVTGTDRYGREFTETIRFTVVEDEAAAQSESQKLLRQDG